MISQGFLPSFPDIFKAKHGFNHQNVPASLGW
jgi:hypothetical protein